VKAVLIGATRGMGRALARRMSARGASLFLLGRDADALARSARDCEARGAAAPVGTAHLDLLEPDGFGAALDTADRALCGFDTVVLSAGLFATQERLEASAPLRRDLLAADFANSVELCEQARVRLLERGGGTLCVFSSVAGERARKPVVLYGAAKAGLSHYLEGLDHRFRARGLRTVTVKPGFVRTGMTEGLAEPPFAGDPDAVAARVLHAIERGTPVVYAPPIWSLVMAAIRSLPRAVLRRVEF
jgi:decaprenylphospho-beta-D-erythro-pentofuranosid-2-ulose 2-reductase